MSEVERLERERDEARANERDALRDLAAVTAERDALRKHYDAAGPEHNLLALLDLYHERWSEARKEAAGRAEENLRLHTALNRVAAFARQERSGADAEARAHDEARKELASERVTHERAEALLRALCGGEAPPPAGEAKP